MVGVSVVEPDAGEPQTLAFVRPVDVEAVVNVVFF
jgi:hypothetical protein